MVPHYRAVRATPEKSRDRGIKRDLFAPTLGTCGRRIVERDCLIDLGPRNEKYPKQLLTGMEISFALGTGQNQIHIRRS
jgi:hypothetical protein